MAQLNINVGSAPNDGTGDSVRGAFINVNANFTEVYNNIGNAIITLVGAYDKANAANVLAYNTGISSNGWANIVGATVAFSSNSHANNLASSGNSYAIFLANSTNAWTNTVGASGNSYALSLAASSNGYANTVWFYSNTWANTTASSANNWANNLATAGNNWVRSTFATLMNVEQIYIATNAAFAAANSALPNSTANIVFGGSLTVAGSISDIYGFLREPVVYSGESNVSVQFASSMLIANNNSRIFVNIDNDGRFISNTLNGAVVTIVQYGSGATTIRPNTNVTLLSANNWLNVATQYAEVRVTRVDSNTWVVTGDLRA